MWHNNKDDRSLIMPPKHPLIKETNFLRQLEPGENIFLKEIPDTTLFLF
jgi:hypothetical protein